MNMNEPEKQNMNPNEVLRSLGGMPHREVPLGRFLFELRLLADGKHARIGASEVARIKDDITRPDSKLAADLFWTRARVKELIENFEAYLLRNEKP